MGNTNTHKIDNYDEQNRKYKKELRTLIRSKVPNTYSILNCNCMSKYKFNLREMRLYYVNKRYDIKEITCQNNIYTIILDNKSILVFTLSNDRLIISLDGKQIHNIYLISE